MNNNLNWVEESVYFEKKQGKQNPQTSTNKHLGSSFSHKKAAFLLYFLFIVFFLIGSRIFFLQIIKGEFYRTSAEKNRQRIIPIQAERGLIYDCQNRQLTKNIPGFSLTIIPQDLPRQPEEKNNLINKLAKLTGIPEDKIKKSLDEYGAYSYESIIIQNNIGYDTALSIMIAADDLPGIQIQDGSKRLYLTSVSSPASSATSTVSSLSHLLGYTGKLNRQELNALYSQGYFPSDVIGKDGIEKKYEKLLRGVYGRKRIEVNASGKEQSVLAEEPPSPGKHLRLTVDFQMQTKLEKILSEYLKNNQKKKGVGIVLDPNNGGILAMVSLPSFNSNDFTNGIKPERYQEYLDNLNEPLFNRAISGAYPSGSVVKPAIAAAALTEGIINPSTSFLSTGGLQVGSWFFPDWQAGGHGITNVRKALAWSINTFFYYIGGGYNDFTGLGVEKIVSHLKEFGFSQPLGIDLPGETSGFLPSKDWKEKTKNEKWYIGDTYNLSIGQGDLLVTPLQIADMTAVFANNGKLLQPHLGKTIINPLTKAEQNIEPKVLRDNFISADNLQTVRLGMKDCVDYGSCQRLSQLPFSVAGKTGTAQWNSNKPNHAWFTSFAPFDKPEIVVTILVEEGGEGSSISAQIAYDFYKWWWGYRNILTRN